MELTKIEFYVEKASKAIRAEVTEGIRKRRATRWSKGSWRGLNEVDVAWEINKPLLSKWFLWTIKMSRKEWIIIEAVVIVHIFTV